MGSLNKVMVIGRLGSEPEVRYTQSGQAVCSFRVATDSRWTNKAGEKQEKTEWHRVTAWGKLGELVVQYVGKGSQVYVEGRLETSEYTDKDGVKRYSTAIVANEVEFLGPRRESTLPKGQVARPEAPREREQELPF